MRYPSHDPLKYFLHAISTPFILLPVIPTFLLHLAVWLYQLIAFPMYGLKQFRVGAFVRFDRERLTYLRGMQWWFCAYCTYMNGIFAYFVAVAGKTEEYWCNVIHKDAPDFVPQPHQKTFSPYGDEQAFIRKLNDKEAGKIN